MNAQRTVCTKIALVALGTSAVLLLGARGTVPTATAGAPSQLVAPVAATPASAGWQ